MLKRLASNFRVNGRTIFDKMTKNSRNSHKSFSIFREISHFNSVSKERNVLHSDKNNNQTH